MNKNLNNKEGEKQSKVPGEAKGLCFSGNFSKFGLL